MQITIHDHDTTTSSRRDNYRFNIVFSVGNEHHFGLTRTLCANFADYAAWMMAAGQIDGYCDEDDDGEIWVTEGKCYSYTFDEYIREHMLTTDGNRLLSEYVAAQLSFAAESVVEDIALI